DHALEQYAAKVEFWQGDISNLVAKFNGYDLILSIGGIEEAINPTRFLQDIHTRLNPGGLLIIADSYDYDPQVTLPQNRVGGFRKDGEPFGSFEGVKELLSPQFEMVDEPLELTRCLRINQRRYDLRLVQVSVWRLK
ncbi:MAG: methyltransferase domain-containing protein, partial [Candidatus Cloacimonadaceae bacterium]|nr:methyltransferase domain-containing protein [Candidatus Cloacimonadaceae bacterium]